MRTRSQKQPVNQLSSAHEVKNTWNEHDVEWSYSVIDHMEFDESTEKYYVFLKWPNGQVSEHDREEVYRRCPQQMLRFYERHIKFV
ncbi:hypothetical protein CDV31_013496 [Fusarium ambrosium]|uniref:Chromo shadow domain-containing protein n=2 Tax=Fusarium solani species complex TaxID=232080 RepID=A0A428T354_9HYPO|nr:hypothetical protein CDV31_013496 [Fusarium ambrosium]